MTGSQTISACGKCILVGEHAVVYGTKAIAMPLPSLRIEVTLFPDRFHQGGHRRDNLPLAIRDIVPQVVAEACTLLDVARPTVAFEGNSTIPVGAGLGSSAALCVVSLRALDRHYELNLSAEKVAQLANVLETRFHGNPSGLDATVVSYENCLTYAKGQKPTPLLLKLTTPLLHFVLVDSVERSSTKDMVERASRHFTSLTGDFLLSQFDQVTAAASDALSKRQELNLADAMNENAKLLNSVEVVTPKMQDVMDQLHRLGAIGVKPTGAGGGGMILGLVPGARADEVWHGIQKSFATEHCHRTSM